MSFWKLVKGLNYRQLLSLMLWFFKHPLFMSATVYATLVTFRVSQNEFPNIHGKNNKANAFRHALWNVLIARKCSFFSKNIDLVLMWTKKITDWHEEFSPNKRLAQLMDYHNNEYGRNFYRLNQNVEISKVVKNLKNDLENAIRIKEIEFLPEAKMVYIED